MPETRNSAVFHEMCPFANMARFSKVSYYTGLAQPVKSVVQDNPGYGHNGPRITQDMAIMDPGYDQSGLIGPRI